MAGPIVVLSDPLLREGASGPDVERLQKLLNAKGATLVVDGDFGNATKMAVRKFQNDKGLVEDGVVGQQTWAVLKA
jgi:peptidoglycan hydrolase-like protein with peptidoglycan-binding domain